MSNDHITAALRRTLEIIRERGWQKRYPQGPNDPVNVQTAVLRSADELTRGKGWYHLYIAQVRAIHDHLGWCGIQGWEFGTWSRKPRSRTQEEVEAMLDEVIGKVERGEVEIVGSKPGRKSGPAV